MEAAFSSFRALRGGVSGQPSFCSSFTSFFSREIPTYIAMDEASTSRRALPVGFLSTMDSVMARPVEA